MENRMHLEFLSLSQNEAFARSVAAAFASQLNPTIEELSDIRTAVSEAVTNAIIHGYEDASGVVSMDCAVRDGVFTVTIEDRGRGMEDIDMCRQPFYTSRPELERSGMGFTVMEAFMEEVSVRSVPGEGTTVTMARRLGQKSA